jgi:hypothetical protein
MCIEERESQPPAAMFQTSNGIGMASMSTKAIVQGSVPRLIQLWIVPCGEKNRPNRKRL